MYWEEAQGYTGEIMPLSCLGDSSVLPWMSWMRLPGRLLPLGAGPGKAVENRWIDEWMDIPKMDSFLLKLIISFTKYMHIDDASLLFYHIPKRICFNGNSILPFQEKYQLVLNSMAATQVKKSWDRRSERLGKSLLKKAAEIN